MIDKIPSDLALATSGRKPEDLMGQMDRRTTKKPKPDYVDVLPDDLPYQGSA